MGVAEETFEDMVKAHRWVAISARFEEAGTAAEKETTAPKDGEDAPTALSKLSPPMVLVEHAPLAVYTNGVLAGFNELRYCAPMSIRHKVESRVARSLELTRKIMERGKSTGARGAEEQRVYDTACGLVEAVMGPFLNECCARVYDITCHV